MPERTVLNVLPGPSADTEGAIDSGFFSRIGGCSDGIYQGLNCGFGSSDRHEDVARNRQRVAAWMGVGNEQLITPHQVHSADVRVVQGAWQASNAPKLDGLVTRRTGLALAILTADCAPILFVDAVSGVVGAAHAGWRGALDGIVAATVSAMEAEGADRSRIRASIGPCISQEAYEVGPEFEANFLFANGEYAEFFERRGAGARPHFDLPGFVAHQLRASGIGKLARTDQCTYANESLFYSYRRSQHRSEPDYGRQISAIVLR